MPRLRKKSEAQKRNSARQAIINFRERNAESDRTRNSEMLASRRENEEYRNIERERDRISHTVRRSYSETRLNEREIDRTRRYSTRSNPDIREVERHRDAIAHSTRRINDESFRRLERERDAIAHTTRRSQDEEFRARERELDSIAHSERRSQNEDFRNRERALDAARHSDRRSNAEIRITEQEQNTLQHSLHREDEEFRLQERERDAIAHSLRRSEDAEFRDSERERDAIAHSLRREEEEFRSREREQDSLAHSTRRMVDEEFRLRERERDAIAHTVRRSEDEEFRALEREQDALAHSIKRAEDEEFRNREREQDAERHLVRRLDSETRIIEQARNTQEHAAHRQDLQFRETERERDTIARSIRRSDPIYHSIEQDRNTNSQRESRTQLRSLTQHLNRIRTLRVRTYRRNPINRLNENQRQAVRSRENRQNLSPESRNQLLESDAQRHTNKMLEEFNENIKKGPTEICICCGGLWFPNQVKQLNKEHFPNLPQAFFLSDIFPSETNNYKFCNTCYKIVRGNKLPTICLHNGLHFPVIPNELSSLTPLEERFVAPRIPFMRIVSLGYNRQCAIRGAVVNVPIPLDRTVNALPRTFADTEVIQVHLKRKLEYNHSFMTEVIRPAKVLEAARYLVNTELYKKHNISIRDEWLNEVGSEEEVPFIASMDDQDIVNRLIHENLDEDVIEEFNPQETLIENNPVENLELSRISIAPGQGQIPRDLIDDEDSEELSYPTIYCGIKRTCKSTVGKIVKSEVRRYDRRCARVDKVLYSYKKVELSKIKSSISTCLRKKVGPLRHTANNMLDNDYVQALVQHDEGYHILKGIRSSPAHWEAEKKKVLAMIRQFGLPTFFITLSAAESQWPELLVLLVKILEEKDITEEEAMAYTTLQKYNLIRMDPITCSRYFDQRIRHLFKHFKANGGIFGNNKVIKFYWRIEFQQRGSPHVHGIYWLDNAPTLNLSDTNSITTVVGFIDKFITTDSTTTEVENYISYQQHNHSRTCQREIRGQKTCRFHIPHPPMPITEILMPLPENMDKKEVEKHQDNYNKIHNFLNAKLSDQDIDQLMSFQQFISHERINLTHEEYILALRSSIKKPQVFLKRTFKDKSINAFNPKILSMQRANMDIQFILDPYACVAYIVNYINKSHRGVSRLLQEAMNEIKSGNYTVKQRLQHYGSKFISASEVSAQEASYNILGMHLSQCSNAEVYINTLVPEKRVRIVKSRQELQNLEPDSTNVFQKNLLDHYEQRPDSIDNICLAYFAAYYKFSKLRRKTSRRQQEEEEDYFEEDDMDIDEVGSALPLKDGSGFVYRKKNPAIIRFPTFNVDVSRVDFFRSIVMLYFPWRNEQLDLLENNNEETCNAFKDIIEHNRLQFEVFKQGQLDEILQRIQEENNDDYQNREDDATATQMLDDEFRALAMPEIDEHINILNINDANQRNRIDESSDEVHLIRLPPIISKENLLASVRGLNVKQREYLHHLLHNVVENIKFFEFVGGGAGVGKSRLIKTIYQSVTVRFNSIPGSNPNLAKVLLSAPTGKAAFGIGGATLHSLFSLPINQSSGEIRPLSNDTVNSLVAKFIEVKLLIIDEISMVGTRMFGHLDARLKQIFKSTEPFGGLSIVVFGDLKQLPPVGDKWIFHTDTSNPYGAIIGETLWNNFNFYELTEIMRQREDLRFAQALNAMAVGQMEEEDIQLIKSREVASNEELPRDAIHLFLTNKDAAVHNTERLQQIETEEYVSTAFDVVKSETLSRAEKDQIKTIVSTKLKPSETQGLCYELKLKTTAKYMMIVNINTSDGLVNGATGVLMEIELQRGSRYPKTLWMLFSEENVGMEARRKKPHTSEPLWTPVDICVRSFQFKRSQQITIERRQFPLVIAEGITIHKSQGATYSKVVVHTTRGMIRAALYVACSRATSLSGLYIVKTFFKPAMLKDSDPVKLELERLNSTKALCLQYEFMNTEDFHIKFFYQNVQSIEAHYSDISTDPTILNSDIICLVETWAFPEEYYIFNGFLLLHKLDCYNSAEEERYRHRRGIMVYIKRNRIADAEYLFGRHLTFATEEDNQENGYILQYIVFRYEDFFFIVLYRGQSLPQFLLKKALFEAIDDLTDRLRAEIGKIFIIGDFNICRKTTIRSYMESYMLKRGFYSLLENSISTTKHGTHIDWAFVNTDVHQIIAKIYKTIHSHHDGIAIGIK